MSGVDLKCEVCKKYYLEPGTELERKQRYIEKWGPVSTTMDRMIAVCPACEKKIKKYMTPELLEKAKEEALKQKKN